jgi:ribosomal protein S12 methylthiotransferase
MRVGLITLGCDKNTVDNEYLAGMLEDKGCEVAFIDDLSAEQAYDAVVVTTCGFIGDAKAQSVDTIVDLTDRKRVSGQPKRVFVAGCLAQRYSDDLMKEMPDVDGIVGVGQFQQLTDLILQNADPAHLSLVRDIPKVQIEHVLRRKRSDQTPHAFLKISDGCNHGCTFCSIPLMKGRNTSVPPRVLLEEARQLLDQGVKELILVAQDLAAYGRDETTDYRLPRFLRELCAIEGDFRVRCLYVYPAGITDELLDVLADEEKVVPYLDVPLQHLDPEVLRKMNRPSKDLNTFKLVEKVRERVPDIALRTTMIVGFPGESRQAHLNMLKGIRELRFNWLGAFQYSKEEDTPAGVMPGQLSRATKERRWKAVMETQAEITAELNQARVGTTARVLVESYDPDRAQWQVRSPHEAPEVDGAIWLQSDRPLTIGSYVHARIT